MTITFDPDEFYDINKSVIICGTAPPEEPIDYLMYEMRAFANSLEIPNLKNTIDTVVSGNFWTEKSVITCHILELEFNDYLMRMLTSATMVGKVVSLFSYESFYPAPSGLDLDNGGAPIADAIAGSLKRQEDVELFLTMDQVFDFVHDHGVEVIRQCSQSKVHITSVPMGRVGT